MSVCIHKYLRRTERHVNLDALKYVRREMKQIISFHAPYRRYVFNGNARAQRNHEKSTSKPRSMYL